MLRRTKRIQDTILKLLSEALIKDLQDPRLGFITFSHVDFSSDLSRAQVFVSILGSDKDKKSSLVALQNSASFLRTSLSKKMTTHTVPKLTFVLDEGLDYSEKMHRLIEKTKRKDLESPLY